MTNTGNNPEFFARVLRAIGAPVTKQGLWFMQAWATAEGSNSAYNPWNSSQTANRITTRTIGSTMGVAGTRVYSDEQSGVDAMASNIINGAYPELLTGLRTVDPEKMIHGLVSSPWASGHYYAKSGPNGTYVATTSDVYKIYENLSGGPPLESVAPNAGDVLSGAVTGVSTVVGGVIGGVESAANFVGSLQKALSFLQTHANRIGLGVMGIAIIIIAVIYMERAKIIPAVTMAAMA